MKEIASFQIYSERVAQFYEGRFQCIPIPDFDRIAELSHVAVPNNSYSAKVEVGSEAFDEVVEILQRNGARFKDCETPMEGATISVGRTLVFDDEDIANAKYLRLQPEKGIIDLDTQAWLDGRYICDGKGKPSFKLGFTDVGNSPAVSGDFLKKLKAEGFVGIDEKEILTDKGKCSEFYVLNASVRAPMTMAGYRTDQDRHIESLDEVEMRCLPGTHHSPEILIYPDGSLDGLGANWICTAENFGRSGDKSPWTLIDASVRQFLEKNKVKMKLHPVLEESEYRSCVTGRLDELLR